MTGGNYLVAAFWKIVREWTSMQAEAVLGLFLLLKVVNMGYRKQVKWVKRGHHPLFYSRLSVLGQSPKYCLALKL